MQDANVYKVLTPAQWGLWRELGVTFGSQHDRRDGYVHMSSGSQLAGTLSKYFSAYGLVWLVAARPAALAPDLRWESARNGGLFPHLYAPFQLRHRAAEWPVRRTAGAWRLPEGVVP